MEPTVIQHESSTRRRKVTKFALAGVAVLGVGAALTSAAWSDNVWFGGDADAADFELQGWDGSNWQNADTPGAAITLPASAFDTLAPGIDDSYQVSVRNAGDIPVYLVDPVIAVAGGLDDTPSTGNVASSFGAYSDGILDPGEQANVVITLTGTDNLVENTTGSVTVLIEGLSEAPAAP